MYKVTFEVRDNEVDIQGVVNNANYPIYLAHARHQYIKTLGINFSEWSEKKLFLFLIETHLYFKKPLRPDDQFYVTCRLIPQGKIKFAVEQEIRMLNDDSLVADALNVCVCIDGNNRNRPLLPEAIAKHLS